MGRTLDAGLLAAEDDGLQELILILLTTAGVGVLDGLDGVSGLLALAEDETLEGNLDAVPALIAVHGIVAADDGGDLADADLLDGVLEFLHVAGGRLGVGVAAVAEEVDEDLGHAGLLGGLEERVEVGLLGVDAAVGDEAAEVQPPVAVLGALEGLLDDLVLRELALAHGLVDAHDVLPHDAAGADVEVADLGVAHEALGQADGERRGVELNVAGGVLGEAVHDGGLGGGDGVALGGRVGRRDAPAVNHDCRSARP